MPNSKVLHSDTSVAMPPFGPELAEQPKKAARKMRSEQPKKAARKTCEVLQRAFGAEPEEGASSEQNLGCAVASSSAQTPFGSEGEEGSSASSSWEPAPADSETPRTFALGWESLASFAQATTWKDFAQKPLERKKRGYDNSKRAAAAQASGLSRRTDVHRRNGLDVERLDALLGQARCQCDEMMLQHVFLFHVFGFCKERSEVHWSIHWCHPGSRRTCYSRFSKPELQRFLEKFWNLTKIDQDSLVPCLFFRC